jgi:hypothetical protein
VSLVDESDALHARVRAFARGERRDDFDGLALAVAELQARWSPSFRRLVKAHGGLTTAERIPAVPTDAFRLTRVALHAPELDAARFFTSGTTGSERGTHCFRTTETYAEVALAGGRDGLRAPEGSRRVVVALATDPGDPGDSSLGFMLRRFMNAFDGRPREAWLIDAEGVRVDALRRAVTAARESDEPLMVLGAAFAWVALLDALGDERLEAPPGSVVMQTGGFKGRSREVDPEGLRAHVAAALGVEPSAVVGEYGMTELSSQLYEDADGERGVYVPPPWLRVTAVDEVTLGVLPDGEAGLARFVDLANVDSAVAVLTQDRVRVDRDGVRLLGRQPGAPPRGCSAALEALLT